MCREVCKLRYARENSAQGDSPSLLEGYVPKITEAYIASRLDSVQAILAGNLPDDPLDNDEQLQDQLDSLPYLCRFQYESTSKYLLSLLDPTLSAYVEMARYDIVQRFQHRGRSLQQQEAKVTPP